MAGFFFCLASAEGAGLLFCPAAIQPRASVYSAFCPVNAILYRPRCKTVYRALHGCFRLFAAFYRRICQTDTSGYNTAYVTLEHITAPQHLQCIPDTNAAPGRYTGQHNRPIIIRYMRVQQIADHASPAGSRCFPRLVLAWHRVSLALAWYCAFFLAQRRGTIDGYRRSFFRAFAR